VPRSSAAVRNTVAYASAELFWGFAWALTMDGPMPAAFGAGFSGSEVFLGTVSLVIAVAIGVPTLLTGYWVEPMRTKRGFVLWGHVAGAVVMLVVALLVARTAAFGDAAVRLAYLAGVGVFFATVGLLIPGWLALVGELFPRGMRARVLGITFVVNRLGALLGGAVARNVLAAPWSPQDQWTFLFAVAGICALVGSVPFAWVVEVPRPRPARRSLRHYLGELWGAVRDLAGLRRFLVADLLGITTMVTIFFYADAAIRRDGLHESWAGTWVALAALVQMGVSALVAWVGERVAPRTWLAVSTSFCVAGAAAAAVGGGALAYGVAAAMGGAWFGVRSSCHAPQVMELAPDRDGTAPIGIAVAFAMLAQGIAPYGAGLLLPSWGYPTVFAAVAAFCAASGLLLLLWVPSTAGNQDASSGGM
jgi:MFS family permease